ncbi:peptidylprolyl isomerase [Scytonema hofmannii PCC 7110]|uniref:peptidylprolyl isomerase n=1 Tax=Scytonema hofmannii PCC 7110 TaxID=128403 RepID=A0A139XFD4_9CYAN|nr:peptidylprolyl isomerase [Scytonema hofmannii]KYC43396.1 peptidylprolyl isomerase [Scytonema hofmannii PCC 7110]
MTDVLQIGNRKIAASELFSLLGSYLMLPQFRRELIIDEAIAPIECTPEEIAQARQQFCVENQFTSKADIQVWMAYYGLALNQLEMIVTRKLKIEKFKQATWGNKLESYFFQYKTKLDKVIYSLLRTQDGGVSQELFFRILAKEQSFAELAREYSQGPEAQTDGVVGSVELSTLHPTMVQMLSSSQPGKLLPPTRIGEWFVIVRLEKYIPAQLDESMRSRLLNELYENWLREQLQKLISEGNKEIREMGMMGR